MTAPCKSALQRKMKYECAKCQNMPFDGSMIIEGGIGYLFCKSCSDVLEYLPTGTIEKFLGPKKETCVSKNIHNSRARRSQGIFLWE